MTATSASGSIPTGLMTVTVRRRVTVKSWSCGRAECRINGPNGRAVPGAGRGRRCIAFL
jgi:hypothetical protein